MATVLVAHDPDPALSDAIRALTSRDYLIVNADNTEIFPFLAQNNSAARLITYGFNAKSCITASSVTDSHVQVCIQRGFVGPTGHLCEPQEFPAPIPSGAEPADVLAAAAYAAVSGAGPVF